MDKIVDITKIIEKQDEKGKQSEKNITPPASLNKATNPILKNLAKFTNEKLSKKFDIKDLLK